MPRKKKTQTCPKCKGEKTADLFYKNQSVCKACSKEYAAAYYANNTEKCNERSNIWNQTNPEKVKAIHATWQEKHEKEVEVFQNKRVPGRVLK